MAIALVSVPTPRQTLCPRRSYTYNNSLFHGSATTLIKCPSKSLHLPSLFFLNLFDFCCRGWSPLLPHQMLFLPTEDVDKLPLRFLEKEEVNGHSFSTVGCKGCGREEIEKGCNGEGRIQGGIATVPGFGWWPIKAYRPCPGFLASGGRYRRQGQSMDEVAFGREQKETPVGIIGEGETRKKRQDPRRLRS
ncbi:hypothetical protein OIU84_022106 [Salix udensis]|uniref:Uncharacterized protein n=1 Tax=Salix udensis TaxID=889485 RepID=A0AAD6PFA9_9ROSI|nr:hypothetical protein OIU84_022106 [Salix udensis]